MLCTPQNALIKSINWP